MDGFFNIMDKIFPFLFFGILIVVIAGFVFNLFMMFSPKLRAKMMKKNIEAAKYLAEDSKGDVADIANSLADMADESKDSLKKMADVGASASHDAVSSTTEAIASGIKKGMNK